MTTRDKMSQVFTVIMGDAVKIVVKKASTRVDAPPKRKHVQTLSQYLQNPRSNQPHVIDCFSIRIRKNCWLISYKALLTLHLLMITTTSESFMSHLASRPTLFNLLGFIDRSSLHAVDMSTGVQLYGQFLTCKCDLYRFCKSDITKKRDSAEKFDLDAIEKIFKELELLKSLLTAAINNKIDFTSNSPLIQTIQMYLLKECLRAYAAYNRRTIYLLENMSDLEAKDAANLILIYRTLVEMHTPIQDMIICGNSKGIEGFKDLVLSKPFPEIINSIEEYVKDIIRIRGSRLLQEKWNVSPSDRPITKTASKMALKSIQSVDFDPTQTMISLEKNFDPSVNSMSDMDSIDFSKTFQIGASDRSMPTKSISETETQNFYGAQPQTARSNQLVDFGLGNQNVASSAQQLSNMQMSLMNDISYIPTPSPIEKGTSSNLDLLLMENIDLTKGYSNTAPMKWNSSVINNQSQTTNFEAKPGGIQYNKQNNPFL